LIGGKWQDAQDGKTLDVEDPATGKVITQIASAGKHDVDLAVSAAQEAFDGAWS